MSEIKSQLRLHTKFTFMNFIRLAFQKFRLKYVGSKVIFDNNVRLMRFPQNIEIHNNVVVKEGARICACNQNAQISIGTNTTVGYHTFIFASNNISIGRDCLIAPFVYLVDSDHGISKDMPINLQPNSTAPIKIGNDVWIGTGAKILKGVTVGDGAVIASGAIVKSNVDPYNIVGGIPAKIIGTR